MKEESCICYTEKRQNHAENATKENEVKAKAKTGIRYSDPYLGM